MAEPRKLYIRTYGCQMNVYDSERMGTALAADGYVQTDRPEDADLIVLNTCHIREKAAEKVYSELGRLRPLKTARPGLKVAVAGCVAQAEGAEILARAPLVDVVVGAPARRRAPAAFLTVQEGCDKFCAFCVVPYTRGAEVSRPAARVLEEARRLVAQGVVEITLLGQNVNAWHGEGPDGREWGLGRLIRALADVEGLSRIRYTTSHPNDMEDGLIAAHAEVPALMPYLHLPVQAGSDRVLRRMNRKHTAESYVRLIERVRAARPDIAISGDFITGFPGETEAEFEATMDLVREVRYAQAYSFKYSPRPGTPAAGAEQVPEDAKADRLARLQSLLSEQQSAFNAATVGRTLPVLVEKPGRHEGQMVGRSPYLQAVHMPASPADSGRILPIRIAAATQNSLSGAPEPAPAETG